jgi:hypothetical protein
MPGTASKHVTAEDTEDAAAKSGTGPGVSSTSASTASTSVSEFSFRTYLPPSLLTSMRAFGVTVKMRAEQPCGEVAIPQARPGCGAAARSGATPIRISNAVRVRCEGLMPYSYAGRINPELS